MLRLHDDGGVKASQPFVDLVTGEKVDFNF